jgi:hypothetical protein
MAFRPVDNHKRQQVIDVKIPYDKWQPLTVTELVNLLDGAPFTWCLAGGYAIEAFLGTAIRPHGDIDIVVYRDEQLSIQQWLDNWQLYAADPPGELKLWQKGEVLPSGVHDIWGHQLGSEAWQLQIMLAEVKGDEWFNRRNPLVRGQREDLITLYDNLPCIRAEIQLMYKSKGLRPKDEQDFQACLPKMSAAAKDWLKDKLALLYPDGHPWLEALS